MNLIFTIIKQYWILILILSTIFYFSLQPETKELIIVYPNSHKKTEVTEDDPRVSSVWKNGKRFIINNTDKYLFLESIYYSMSSSSHTPKIIRIKPGINPIDIKVNYVFKTPPNSIRIKSGGSRTRWHLHR